MLAIQNIITLFHCFTCAYNNGDQNFVSSACNSVKVVCQHIYISLPIAQSCSIRSLVYSLSVCINAFLCARLLPFKESRWFVFFITDITLCFALIIKGKMLVT